MDWSSNKIEHTRYDDMQSPPHKKRKISSNTAQRTPNTKTSLSSRDQVEPWSIGQRIIIQLFDPKDKNSSRKIGREATIRDYDPNTGLTHIWFETEENNFENVNLLELEEWDVANNKALYKQIEFVPDKHWTPYYWKLGQRVMVRFDGKFGNGCDFAAFIDAFDPISRRHHINYGDTTEWIWATKDRVKIYKRRCAHYIEVKLSQHLDAQYVITAPPWNPLLYGLDETFAKKSIQIEQRRRRNMNIVSSRNKNMNINAKKKKIFGNKSVPRRIKLSNNKQNTNTLMKSAPCCNLDVINGRSRLKQKADTDFISIKSWSSSHSTFDTKGYHGGSDTDSDLSTLKPRKPQPINNKKSERKSRENAFEPIQVSVTTNIVVTNNTPRSSTKKKKISLRIPKKSRITKVINNENKQKISETKAIVNKTLNNSGKKHVLAEQIENGNETASNESNRMKHKYPRKVIINGEHWIRHYSRNDRKYYWLITNDNNDIMAKEWDPWRKHGKKAPWIKSIAMQKWGKFMDTKKGEYYYNYDTKQSTFNRPKGFESDVEIECDSADNDNGK